MKNPYLPFVEAVAGAIRAGKEIPCGGMEPRAAVIPANGKTVLLFSPHPDDECITGLLPLRLMREGGMRIVNVPVTFGSNVARQAQRHEELENASGFLGWDLCERSGFQPLGKPEVVEILETLHPSVIFFPHSKDWNSRHVATHFLVMDALAEMAPSFSCRVVETEFWATMPDPNLVVEADAPTLADLVAAVSFHAKEVERNPYHLSLPAWMQDNVRRGGELVGGQGGTVPDFSFATLYRMRRWAAGRLVPCLERGLMLGMGANLEALF